MALSYRKPRARLVRPVMNSPSLSVSNFLFTGLLCALSFYAGMLHSALLCIGTASDMERVERLVQERMTFELAKAMEDKTSLCESTGVGGFLSNWGNAKNKMRFPDSAKKLGAGAVRTSGEQLMKMYDPGTPQTGKSGDALILYSGKNAMPHSEKIRNEAIYENGNGIPFVEATDATSNCDVMKVVTFNVGSEAHCLVINSGFQDYHIQKWMRSPLKGPLDHKFPLRFVQRSQPANGGQKYRIPDDTDIKVKKEHRA